MFNKALVLLMISVGVVSCATVPKLVGNGKQRTDERFVGKFDSLKVAENLKVELVVGESTLVKVTGDDNILYAVKTDLSGSNLVIKTQCECTLNPTMPITVEIPANQVTSVKAEGLAKVSARGLKSDELMISLEDESEATLYEQKITKLILNLTDDSKAVISGAVENLKVDLEDRAQLDAQQVVAQNAKIEFHDKAQGSMQIVEELNAQIEDQSKLTLMKEPKTAKTEVKDGATIIRNY